MPDLDLNDTSCDDIDPERSFDPDPDARSDSNLDLNDTSCDDIDPDARSDSNLDLKRDLDHTHICDCDWNHTLLPNRDHNCDANPEANPNRLYRQDLQHIRLR